MPYKVVTKGGSLEDKMGKIEIGKRVVIVGKNPWKGGVRPGHGESGRSGRRSVASKN